MASSKTSDTRLCQNSFVLSGAPPIDYPESSTVPAAFGFHYRQDPVLKALANSYPHGGHGGLPPLATIGWHVPDVPDRYFRLLALAGVRLRMTEGTPSPSQVRIKPLLFDRIESARSHRRRHPCACPPWSCQVRSFITALATLVEYDTTRHPEHVYSHTSSTLNTRV